MMKVKASSYGYLEGDFVKKDDFVYVGEEKDNKLSGDNCKLFQKKVCCILWTCNFVFVLFYLLYILSQACYFCFNKFNSFVFNGTSSYFKVRLYSIFYLFYIFTNNMPLPYMGEKGKNVQELYSQKCEMLLQVF